MSLFERQQIWPVPPLHEETGVSPVLGAAKPH
jgi:hypothetical protein